MQSGASASPRPLQHLHHRAEPTGARKLQRCAPVAIGKPGATNAALLALAILANERPALRERLRAFRAEQTARILRETLP